LSGQPVIFGEVLFDCLPSGEEVLGGAPFNVAWHLAGFGLQPLTISRVGDDARGRRVLEAMADWGMSTAGIQIDDDHPTGVVTVSLDGGQPSYTIEADQAYDQIDATEAVAATAGHRLSLLCHGTLALRSARPRTALESLRDGLGLPAFLDVNLRRPWDDAQLVRAQLAAASWVKVNDDELVWLARRARGRDQPLPEAGEAPVAQRYLEEAAWQTVAAVGLRWLVVTEGDRGAFAVGEVADHRIGQSETVRIEAASVDEMVDTVGAGDGFTSVCIAGLLRGWSLPTTLRRAARFAAQLCGQKGATSADRRLYEGTLETWRGEDESER
jgi:fructokinase